MCWRNEIKRAVLISLIITFGILYRNSNAFSQIDCYDAKECCDKFSDFKLTKDERFQCLTKAIELDLSGGCGQGRDGTAYFFRGILYSLNREYEKAIEDYNEAIKNDPEHYSSYNARGIAFLNIGDDESALQDLNKAIELNIDAWGPSGTYWFNRNEPFNHIHDFQKEIDIENSEMLTTRGIIYSHLRDHSKAIEDFTKAIKLNGYNVRAFFKRGIAYSDTGDYDRAILDFTKAIDLQPKNASDVNYFCITEYDEICDYSKIDQVIKIENELMFKNSRAYFRRGVAYSAKSDFQNAMKDYNKALELNPENADAYFYRGSLYSEIEDYDKSIENYSNAIELNPAYADAYYNRGLDYEEQGDYDSEIKDFQKYLELNPDAEDRDDVLKWIEELENKSGD